MNPDIRWKQRFQNFDRALTLLDEALKDGPEALNQLETEGVVQRFEYSFELAWKVMKDFLDESGVMISVVTPKSVIKEAYSAKLIADGQVWIDMLNHRNLLSHTYNQANFEKAVVAIDARYLVAMRGLREFFQGRSE